jgi:signal transduction histidine kinase
MNPMTVTAPLVLGIGTEATFRTLLEEATKKAFADATVLRGADLSTARTLSDDDGRVEQLLVLHAPAAETVAQALAEVDGSGLPRWAVVILGSAPEGVDESSAEIVAREDWNVPVVATALRAARTRHRLARENARFRGDLATFGFRIAHDLRTPLGGVMTTTEMLREILNDVAPQQAAFADPIVESADGLVKLIDRMSFIAKTVASREPAQRVGMMQPFWNAYQQSESALFAAGASLTHPSEWPSVHAHASWLEFVWRQLIANAIQHGGRGVKIEAGWTSTEGGYRFFVKDSGTVAPEKRALLFHPFERLHEPGAPRGLGLPTVRRLVELDGGRCEFEALEGGGSVFSFVLPVVGN